MGDELESNTYPSQLERLACENSRNRVFGGLEVIPLSLNYMPALGGCLQARLPQKSQKVARPPAEASDPRGLQDPVLGRYAPPGVCLSCS